MKGIRCFGMLCVILLFAGCSSDEPNGPADSGQHDEDGSISSTEDQNSQQDDGGNNQGDDGGIIQDHAGSDGDGGLDGSDGCVTKDNCLTLSQCANLCGTDTSCINLCKNAACQEAIDDFADLTACSATHCLNPCVIQPDQTQCSTCVSQNCAPEMTTCAAQTCPQECGSDGDGGIDGGDGHAGDGGGDQELQNCLTVLACLQATPTNPACMQNTCPDAVSLAQAFIMCSGQACLGSCASNCGSWCSGLNTTACQTCVTQACSSEMADCIADHC